MEQSEQVKILTSLHARIRDTVNIGAILPHLNEKALLTVQEGEILTNSNFTVYDKIDRLVQWVPRKGTDALSRFILCLRRSSGDALGHGELVKLLELEVEKAQKKATIMVSQSGSDADDNKPPPIPVKQINGKLVG